MKLVKLGGSAITYKGRDRRFRRRVTERLAAELAPFKDDLCIVHGGGSFGHPLAHAFRLQQGMAGADQLQGFAQVHHSMRDLNLRVLGVLQAQGIPAVSIPPALLVTVENGKVSSFASKTFWQHIDRGLVPVTFGDVVLDGVRGSSILSGDDLMLHLARDLDPELAVFVADVEGVRGPDGSILQEVSRPLPDLTYPEGRDVTGGLQRKLDLMMQMAEEGHRCLLLSGLVRGRLKAALEGRRVPGTEVRAS